MKLSRNILKFVFLGFLSVINGFGQPAVPPAKSNATKPEARGVWVHLSNFSSDPAVGGKQVRDWVNQMADANFNLVLPWVLSDYVAPLLDLKNTQSTNSSWSALGEMIEASKERGLELHVWYSFTYYKSPQSPEFDPAFGGDPQWAALRISEWLPGKSTPTKRLMTDVCPMHPEARAWEIKLIERMLEKFPKIAGIHIEEPGFGYPGSCVCDLCRSLYRQFHPQELTDVIDTPAAEDFRCLGTTEFIRELRDRLSHHKTRVIFSVNGGPIWRADRSLGRDWRRWADLGWLDYYAAQNYTPDVGGFTQYTKGVIADLRGCPVLAGIGIEWSGGKTPLDAALKEVEAAREQGAQGVIFFSAAAIKEEHLKALKAGLFKEPAVLPWKKK